MSKNRKKKFVTQRRRPEVRKKSKMKISIILLALLFVGIALTALGLSWKTDAADAVANGSAIANDSANGSKLKLVVPTSYEVHLDEDDLFYYIEIHLPENQKLGVGSLGSAPVARK